LKTEEKLRYELSNIDENIEKTEKEIGLIKKEIEKTNIHTIKEMLQNEINDVLKVDVVIG
jgi:predicted  nucleic acid-binding Zn-ribbon protein